MPAIHLPPAGRFLRGNTHCHTDLCGHADSPPETVAAWYREAGYDFLVISEHNLFVDPARLAVPRDPGFLLIPGEEITQPGAHTGASGIRTLIPPVEEPMLPAAEIVRRNIASIRAQGGVPQVNHPNFRWQLSLPDLLSLPDVSLLEIWNGHPLVQNDGDASHPPVEAMWDALLAQGRRVFGIAVDDAHHFRTWGPEWSNPGRGWVMVRAPRRTPAAILSALDGGDFYASTGVLLADLRARDAEIGLAVVPVPGETCRIEFVADGRVVEGRDGWEAAFQRPPGTRSLRARVASSSGRRAWTQPVFA